MATKGIHVTLSTDNKEKLLSFSSNRHKSQSAIIERALELLFTLEDENYGRETGLKTILERKFVIPRNIPIRSFYVFLYLLSMRYPDASSKEFWNESVYVLERDKSHREIFAEIKDEYNALIKKNGFAK